jgi:dTDP-4-amino-4,6-dideoxygalactose transaminase
MVPGNQERIEMNIRFLDLSREYLKHKSELDSAISQTLLEFNLVRGKQVFEFEKQFGKKIGVNQVISTGNGTDALYASLKMLGIGPGDEVITPAFSWISSAETISQCGARPVFADIDPEYYTLDPERVKEKITSSTKAILAVHLYGQMADVVALKRICSDYKLFLIEDCAQAHLSSLNNQCAGTFGDAGCFSFYPTKNLGAYGDAGSVVTNNVVLASKLRRFVNHGALEKDDHLIEGVNSRMDTLQAGILLIKLTYLEQANRLRQNNAAHYNRLLNDVPEIKIPSVRPGSSHVYHLYVVQARDRNALQKYLQNEGVQTLIHYPSALPNLEPYKYLNTEISDVKIANQMEQHALSLPIYPDLTNEEIGYVCEKIKRFYNK